MSAALTPLIDRLHSGDPDRLAMALLAPASARGRLLSLYALNDELARTALAAREPLVAEMRVRWWVDRLAAMADGPPAPHDLLTALWQAWGPDAAALSVLAEARMHDAAREPLTGPDAVVAYAEATGGVLMALAAGVSGAGDVQAARIQGRAAALVAWLRARPALEPLGLGLVQSSPDRLRDLAGRARRDFAEARAARRNVPRAAAPVLFPGAAIRAALRRADAGCDPVAASDFSRRAALARLALTGRWWL